MPRNTRTKKFTASIDYGLGEEVKVLAEKRGQTLAQFTESVFTNALKAEEYLEYTRKAALKEQLAKDLAA